MIEILLATALTTQHPTVWANDYCVSRAFDNTHEQATALANDATGEMTPEAWEHTKTHNWCLELPENQPKTDD